MYIAVHRQQTVLIRIRCFNVKARAPYLGARAFTLMDGRSFVPSDLVGDDEADTKDDTKHQSE